MRSVCKAIDEVLNKLDLDDFTEELEFSKWYPDGPVLRLVFWVRTDEWFDEETREKNKLIFREIKRMFGPLKEKGSPPYVELVGTWESPSGATVVMTVHGAFKCNIVEKEEVPLPESDREIILAEIKNLTSRLEKGTKTINHHDCTAAVPTISD